MREFSKLTKVSEIGNLEVMAAGSLMIGFQIHQDAVIFYFHL